jgi:hypothetical protein
VNCQRLHQWFAVAALATLIGIAHAQNVPTAQVPFVGCPGIGGVDPGPWPVPKGAPKALPSPATVPAAQIAYYRAINGPGVFAPRGWHCLAEGGASGSFIMVSPTALPAVIPREPSLSPSDDALAQALIMLELKCLNRSWPSC